MNLYGQLELEKIASSDDANAMCSFIRKTIGELYGDEKKI